MMKKINTFALIALLAVGSQAAVLNEWLFDQDVAGLTLSQATNSGADTAVFSPDTAPVTQTDGARGLICANDVSDTGSLWTNGAVLTADVSNQVAGVRYLRYDFDYDMTSVSNDTGTLLGLAFSDGISTNLAGIVLQYDIGSPNVAPPAGVETVEITTLDPGVTGHLSVIAKVDLGAQTMSVWYDLSGGNTFNPSNSPDATTAISLASIDDLVFWASGDFIATVANECVVIDNIRTSSTWEEAVRKPVNLLSPAEFTVSISDSMGGTMGAGQTNDISVTIYNSGAAATGAVSTLVHNGGAGLSIISSNNAAVSISAGGSVVQTFSVVANANGPYVLTAQAYEGGVTNGAPATFNLFVGTRVSFVSGVATNDVGGAFPGEIEPSETFDLIITSINDGGVPATGITNSLTADNPAEFPSVVATNSNTYALLNDGATTSTTYRVTCAASTAAGLKTFTVINRTGDGAWTNQFQINVRREAAPSVSTNAVTITVAVGEKASATLTLSNVGNAAGDYTFAEVGNWAGQYYAVSTQTESMVSFYQNYDEVDTSTTFTNWGANGTTTMPIGFSFPLMGSTYANFFVSRYGALSFSAVVGANNTATLPSGTAALAAPFWGNTLIDTNSIRYTKADTNKLVVAWGNRTGAEFQAWLYPDGRIRYLYDQATWTTNGAIGVQRSGTVYQNVNYLPGSGGESLLLTPIAWVTHTPDSGSLARGGSQVITYTADATGKSAGTTVLTNTVSMGSTTLQIKVTVIVQAATKTLTVTPSPVTFFGPAGSLTNTTMTVSNSGNTTLTYTIRDLGAQAGGYAWTNVNDTFNWDSTHWDANSHDAVPLLNNSDDKTDWIQFGFGFPFYGTVYTAFKIDANGGIVLNSSGAIAGGYDRAISAYFPVSLDDNATLRYSGDENKMVVTWENTYQDVAGPDQTFQLIAYKNGNIKCQYLSVSGTSLWPNAEIYVDDDINTSGLETVATLERTGDGGTVTYSTNYVVTTNGYYLLPNGDPTDTPIVVTNTTVVTNYISVVREEAILFYPSSRIVIAASPVSGTLAPGTSAPITIYGDARSLTPMAGGTSVVATTTLAVSSAAPTTNISVTFTATNSATASYAALAADLAVRDSLWGTDDPFVSSQKNADGSRTLSWPAAQDPFSRTYTIWYTTSLSDDWTLLATVDNLTSYTDTHHNNEPAIFYKVTVQ